MAKERDLQMAVVTWLRLQYPHALFFSIPNEQLYSGANAAKAGANLNRMGRLAGVADLFIAEPRSGYHGLFIEFKAKDGKQAQTQKTFSTEAQARHYLYHVSRDFEDAKHYTHTYLSLAK